LKQLKKTGRYQMAKLFGVLKKKNELLY